MKHINNLTVNYYSVTLLLFTNFEYHPLFVHLTSVCIEKLLKKTMNMFLLKILSNVCVRKINIKR